MEYLFDLEFYELLEKYLDANVYMLMMVLMEQKELLLIEMNKDMKRIMIYNYDFKRSFKFDIASIFVDDALLMNNDG